MSCTRKGFFPSIYLLGIVLAFCCSLSAAAQTVSATISVGSYPYALAVDSSLGYLYVANYNGNTVSVINLSTRAVIATVSVGSSPDAIDLSTSTHLVYVASASSGNVTIIDPTNSFSTTSVSAGSNQTAIVVNPVNGNIYVVNNTKAYSGGMTIIEPSNNNGIVTVQTAEPLTNKITVDPNTGTVYATSLGYTSCTSCNGYVTAVNPTTNAPTDISIGPWPIAIAVDSATDKVYVSDSGGSTLTVITPGSSYTTSSITVGSTPGPLAIDSYSNVYVGLNNSTVKIVDTAAGNTLSTVSVGQVPMAMAFDSSSGLVCVATSAGSSTVGKVAFISASSGSLVSTLSVGLAPQAIAVDTVRGESYVANSSSNTVTVITD